MRCGEWGLALAGGNTVARLDRQGLQHLSLGGESLLKSPHCGKCSARGVSVCVSVRAFVDASVFPLVVPTIRNCFFFSFLTWGGALFVDSYFKNKDPYFTNKDAYFKNKDAYFKNKDSYFKIKLRA